MPYNKRLAIVMISLNEAHNLDAVLTNVKNIADEVFLVDSFSNDNTVEIALKHGVKVYQRAFRGFGDQWNYAVNELPITSKWTMKLDPDERLSPSLKANLISALDSVDDAAFSVTRRLWFMGKPMPVKQDILRVWRTGKCKFNDVLVNEHPIVDAPKRLLKGNLEHHDSPTLEHWVAKQNSYTSAEAKVIFEKLNLSAKPQMFGSSLERRMFFKSVFRHVPGRHLAMFSYCFLVQGAWKAGRVGYNWAKLRVWVYEMIEFKLADIRRLDASYSKPVVGTGPPHPDAHQCDQT